MNQITFLSKKMNSINMNKVLVLALLVVSVFSCKQTADKAQDVAEEAVEEVVEAVAEVDPAAIWETEVMKAKISDAGSVAEVSDEGTVYMVDAEASSVQWHGEKAAYGHYGTIDIAEGMLVAANGALTAGSVMVDVNSISSVDLAADAEKKGKLEGHLKSPDFFSAEEHPTAGIAITGVETGDDGTAMISGNLTIKGITHQVTFPAKVSMDGNTMTATAIFSFDRSKWDVRYGSGSFFDDLGDKIISDDIDLSISLVATAAGAEA